MQHVPLPDGRVGVATTLSLHPLILNINGFLTESECEVLIGLAQPRMQARTNAQCGQATMRS